MAGERRVALVIGNGRYEHAPPLTNPKNDARAMSAMLKKLGFEVHDGIDLNRRDTANIQSRFEAGLDNADVALMFYAGHGLQVDGKNYLVPIDAEIRNRTDLDYFAVQFDVLLRPMASHAGASLIFLDACRDNPFTRNIIRSLGGDTTRDMGVRSGLAEMEKVAGTFIAYATAPNHVAYDGRGANSPFTKALLEHIETPGLSVSDMMIDVRNKVLADTNHRQEPWDQSSLRSRFYFVDKEPDPIPDPTGAAAEWSVIQHTTSLAVLARFRDEHPEKSWCDYADARMEELRQADEERREREEAERLKKQKSPVASDHGSPLGQAYWKWGGAAMVALIGAGVLYNSIDQPSIPSSSKKTEPVKEKEIAKPEELPVKTREGAVTFKIGLAGQKKTVSIVPGSKESFQDAPFTPKLVVVPEGKYKRGSEDGNSDEKPVQTVTISQPFAVGQFEVTFDEWDACVADGGCNGYKPEDQGWGRVKRPVINVSWNDAQGYIKWLNKKVSGSEDGPYRLLSEAEWEYAARAGTTTKYWWGDDISKNQAQYSEGSWGSEKQTVPVDSFEPNTWGLYNVHGNVWEWVQDHYHNSYKGSPADGSAWIDVSATDSVSRVLRGGSWVYAPRGLRSAYRNWYSPSGRSYDIGFRLSRTLTP